MRYFSNIPWWIILLLTALLPGTGHIIMGKPLRGLVFVFWIIIFAYITFQLSASSISPVGRLSGGIAVWILSILEIYKLLKKSHRSEHA